jgi:hypothetical protein
MPFVHMTESAKAFIEQAVRPGTRASNMAALKVWEEFRNQARDDFGFYLLDAPTDRDAVLVLLDFVTWANKIKGFSANGTTQLCGKLKWNFVGQVANTHIFDNMSLRTCLKGIREGSSVSVSDLQKSPNQALLWILPLNTIAREMFWVPGVVDDRMAYIGISLAFHFSLRIGEITNVGPYNQPPKYTPDHRFYWCDIIFEGADDNTDYTFAQYKATNPRPNIELVLFVKNTSKTSSISDRRAKPDGKPYYLTKNSIPEEELLTDFLLWAEECNHSNQDQPLACRTHAALLSNLDLQSKALVDVMKVVGKTQNLQGFSGKSLRGGGSSTLAAAGYSDSQILNSVGHKSLSSNQHYQSGTSSGNVYAMGAGNPISLQDVHRVSKVNQMNQSRSKKPRA